MKPDSDFIDRATFESMIDEIVATRTLAPLARLSNRLDQRDSLKRESLKKRLSRDFLVKVAAMVDYHILRSKDIGGQVETPSARAIVMQIHGGTTGAQQFADIVGRGGGDPRATDLRNAHLEKMSFEAKLARKLELKQLFDTATK
jgi:hypothetical protein